MLAAAVTWQSPISPQMFLQTGLGRASTRQLGQLPVDVIPHQSCEGTLGLYGTIPFKTIWSRLPYVMVDRWDFYGTIGYGTLD